MKKKKKIPLNAKLVKQLIAVVWQHPILYDTSIPQSKDRRTKDKVWEKISALLEIPEEDIRRRWKSLRDSYIKHLRSATAGEGTLLERYGTWPWAEQMSNFKPFFKIEQENEDNQEEVSYYNSNVDTTTETRSDIDEVEVPLYIPKYENPLSVYITAESPEDTRAVDKETFEERTRNDVSKSSRGNPYLCENIDNNVQEYDEIDLMCLSYAKTIKKFSLERQALLKFKLSEIILKEELAHIQEDSMPSTSNSRKRRLD